MCPFPMSIPQMDDDEHCSSACSTLMAYAVRQLSALARHTIAVATQRARADAAVLACDLGASSAEDLA